MTSLPPLDDHQVRRMDRIRELDPLAGWGVDASGAPFVDAAGQRYSGASLHVAIGEALRALESEPRRYGVTA